uniref:Uncharacterized protein n=1 Tax=Vespula pensylvanica TaxID=30213 RepID=A0A834PEQ1_VESPE|nr:hypothetical protein H0235_000571 [Vespula pensylvanica]
MGDLSKRAPGVTRHGAWLSTVAAILVSFPFLRTDQPTLPRADMHDEKESHIPSSSLYRHCRSYQSSTTNALSHG